MKLGPRITNITAHTRILRGLLAIIVVSCAIMIYKQQQGTTVDQYRENAQIRFTGTTGDTPVILEVDIADTPYKQAYGLMFRGQINRGKGMLFVFPEEEIRSFWMKNTYIPLDMIFINKSGTIVHIHPGAKPIDETPISSIQPAKYVIEVNSGWTLEAGLQPGMGIDLSTIPKS